MIILVFEWRPFWILPKMVDPAILQIGSIKNMKEYCLMGLYTNFHNFSQMCKLITLWSPTIVDDCTSNKFEIDEKWVFSIFFASLTLKWPWCDIELTLVLCTSKTQLLLLLRFCWCLHTLQNSLICLPPTTLPTNSAVEMQVCPGVQWEKG